MFTQSIISYIASTIAISAEGPRDSDQHLATLMSMVLNCRARQVLELGVRMGDTTLPMLVGCYFTGGHLTSVDIHPTTFKAPADLNDKWTFVQSDALEFLEESAKSGAHFDMVFIDDWHTTEHVKKELELLDKMTSISSIILLHDLMHSYSHPNYNEDVQAGGEFEGTGPYGAIKQLDKDKWEWATIPYCHGLTLLRKVKE